MRVCSKKSKSVRQEKSVYAPIHIAQVCHQPTPLVAACVATLALLAACGGGGDPVASQSPALAVTSDVSTVARQAQIEASLIANADGFQLGILGLELGNTDKIVVNGADILATLNSAAAMGLGEFQALGNEGFYFVSSARPSDVGLPADLKSMTITTRDGSSQLAAPTLEGLDTPPSEDAPEQVAPTVGKMKSCPWLSFGQPTTVSPNKRCGFNSTNCAVAGSSHTGVDFSGSGSAVAAADGIVVRVETKSSNDHGMGSSVILAHTLSNCSTIYSSYSHLATIDKAIRVGLPIKRASRLGDIGGSGYGRSNYWGTHLHFELKTAAVTGNPVGVGSKKKTCQSDDGKSAGPSTCWGYVNRSLGAGAYGYLNPADYLGK